MEVDAHRGDLIVVLRLFGFASDFVGPACEAMTAALTTRLNVSGGKGYFYPRAKILDRSISSVEGLEVPYVGERLRLDFLSPVLLSKKKVIHASRSLITTTAARLSGLARWHDAELVIDRQVLVETSHRLTYDWFGPTKVNWMRKSDRQNRLIPMAGYVGGLEISGLRSDLAFASLLLTFGQRSHIGADAAYGCGRFDLL